MLKLGFKIEIIGFRAKLRLKLTQANEFQVYSVFFINSKTHFYVTGS